MKTSKELNLTPEQRRNIAKLSWFAFTQLRAEQFDITTILSTTDTDGMYWYFDTDCPSKRVYNECGTTGCFLGHGINAGIKARRHETFGKYAARCFGVNYSDYLEYGKIYSLLFDEGHRNCPRAAALRGAYLLTNGFPSEHEDEMRTWEVPSNFKPDWKAIRRIANRKPAKTK